MKADFDEMIGNPDEGLQVPENYLEVFTEGPATKPEVPVPTQAEMEKFYFTTAVEQFLIYILPLYPALNWGPIHSQALDVKLPGVIRDSVSYCPHSRSDAIKQQTVGIKKGWHEVFSFSNISMHTSTLE